MSNSISTIDNPLYFFQDLISYKTLETMIKSFKENSPFDYFDSENLIATDSYVDENGNFIKIEDKFDHHLLKVLNRETLISIKLIDQSFRQNLEETVSPIKIKNVLDILYSLNKGISQNLPLNVQNLIHQSLIDIVSHIYKEYGILGIAHRSRHLIRKTKSIDISYSLFGAVKENFKFYRELHEVLYDNDIIPESEEDDDLFFQLLISEKPKDLGTFIPFSKSNRDVAFILRALYPFFKNFNFKTIGESGCFLNKKRKVLNTSDLDTALSEASKYYKNNPHKRLNNQTQSVINWINAQQPNYSLFS